MSSPPDYQVRFLAADGSPMEDVTILAKSLAVAVNCAGAVGAGIGVSTFYISPMPQAKVSRPGAAARRKPGEYRQSDPQPLEGAVAP